MSEQITICPIFTKTWIRHFFAEAFGLNADLRVVNTVLRLVVLFMLTATWFFSPIFSTLPVIAYLYFVRVSKYEILFYFFLLSTVPGLINYTKTPLSDLYIYYQTYNELWSKDLVNLTDTVTADFFFYLVSAILAKISGGQQQLFVLFWSTTTYFTYFLTLRLAVQRAPDYNKKILIGVVFYSLCIGLSFSLSGHLVRQFAAVSLLLYSVILYSHNERSYWFFFGLAVLSHFSTAIFVLYFFIGKMDKKNRTTIVIILFVISLIVGTFNLLNLLAPLVGSSNDLFLLHEISQKAAFYAEKMDGEVRTRELVGILLCSMLALKLYVYSKSRVIEKFLISYFLLIIILLFTRGNDLLLLRYSFYYDLFAGFVLLFFASEHWELFYVRSFFYIIVLTAPIRFMRVISDGAWTYIDNSHTIVFNSVISFLSYHP